MEQLAIYWLSCTCSDTPSGSAEYSAATAASHWFFVVIEEQPLVSSHVAPVLMILYGDGYGVGLGVGGVGNGVGYGVVGAANGYPVIGAQLPLMHVVPLGQPEVLWQVP